MSAKCGCEWRVFLKSSGPEYIRGHGISSATMVLLFLLFLFFLWEIKMQAVSVALNNFYKSVGFHEGLWILHYLFQASKQMIWGFLPCQYM